MSRIVLLRHAQSEWNAVGRWQGHGDPSLSALGLEQAQAVAVRLSAAGLGFERVVASDLARALETAEIVGKQLGLAVQREPLWRERDIGTWTGLTHEEIAARWPEDYAHFRAHEEHARPGGGESNAMLRARAQRALAALRAKHGRARVLVVTHRGIARMLAPETPLGNAEWCELAETSSKRRRD
ncbi:MAG TPA: histidine phosphatase family protein [Myxococcota bacterium]|nr:histidine phosphatase family protein [Myxococcota bacterium]